MSSSITISRLLVSLLPPILFPPAGVLQGRSPGCPGGHEGPPAVQAPHHRPSRLQAQTHDGGAQEDGNRMVAPPLLIFPVLIPSPLLPPFLIYHLFYISSLLFLFPLFFPPPLPSLPFSSTPLPSLPLSSPPLSSSLLTSLLLCTGVLLQVYR